MTQSRPEQAIILAGGRGTRLRPFSDLWPKPMAEFHGRPFLEYLLVELKRNGFTRVLLLLGYRAEVIRRHFGDGRALGLAIDYSINPVEFETGARLRAAVAQIDPLFMLLYCDNIWSMPFAAMWQRFQALKPLGMITAYANSDNYTRSNLQVGADGLVSVYDKSRKAEGLQGVDIGFAILRRSALDLMPEGNVSFEAEVYPQLVAQCALAAFITEHRYYSVGSVERLPATEVFLARRPTILLDRDGVLNERPPQAGYIKAVDEWRWARGALEALALLTKSGYRLIVITNQAGVGRGMLTLDTLHNIHRRMADDAAAAGAHIEAVYYCPHHWDENCDCRKPKPGMLFAAQRDYVLDLSRCCYIGDDERDEMAANAAFCPFHFVTAERPLVDVARSILAGPSLAVDLATAVHST